MIKWFHLDFSVPLFVPPSGMVASYLIVGLLLLLFLTVKDRGFRRVIASDPAWMGLLAIGLLMLMWPVAAWFMARALYRYLARNASRWPSLAWSMVRRLVIKACGFLGDERLAFAAGVILVFTAAPARLFDANWLMLAVDLVLGGFLLVYGWRSLGSKAVVL